MSNSMFHTSCGFQSRRILICIMMVIVATLVALV